MRKFIVASGDESRRRVLGELLVKHFPQSTIIQAIHGLEAQAKVENDAPTILFVDVDIPKKNGVRLAEWLISNKKFERVAVVLLSPIPDQEKFVDEVVLGRVQFLDNYLDELKLSKVVSRALNFVTSDEKRDFRIRFLAPEDVVMREGERAESVFILKRGQMKAFLERDGKEVLLGQIEPGEFVGEMAYINGEPRSANVIALTDCELIEIPVDSLDHVLFQKPAWSKALMKTLSKRVKVGNAKRGAA